MSDAAQYRVDIEARAQEVCRTLPFRTIEADSEETETAEYYGYDLHEGEHIVYVEFAPMQKFDILETASDLEGYLRNQTQLFDLDGTIVALEHPPDYVADTNGTSVYLAFCT